MAVLWVRGKASVRFWVRVRDMFRVIFSIWVSVRVRLGLGLGLGLWFV